MRTWAPWFAMVLFPLTASGTLRADPPTRPILFPNPAYTVGTSNNGFMPTEIGDIDANGFPDLAVLSMRLAPRIDILLGQGGGALEPGPGIDLESGSFPSCIRLGDIDGDGDADLVAALQDYFQSRFLVWRSAGDGSFLPPTSIAGNGYANPFNLADVDGDGDLDMLVPNQHQYNGGEDFRFGINPGNGDFYGFAQVNLPLMSHAVRPDVVDFNHDAYPDLIVKDYDEFSVFLGGPSLQFGSASRITIPERVESYAIGDFNLDGRPDVVAKSTGQSTGHDYILFGDAAGHLTLVNSFATPPGKRVRALDVDGDGRLDLAEEAVIAFPGDLVIEQVGMVRVSRGGGNGQFTPDMDIPADPQDELLTTDIDRDGRPDILAAGHSAVGILLNGPDHRFGQHVLGQAPGGPVFVRDLNEDGLDDVLAAGERISFFPGVAGGGLGPQASFPGAPDDPATLALGQRSVLFDANGDGHLDAAMTSESITSVALGGGDGGFGPVSVVTGGERHDGIVAFDLGEDGDSDLGLACLQSECVLESLGTGFAPHYRVAVPNGFKNMVGGDLDGDGRLDLVGTVDGRIGLFENPTGLPHSPHSLRVMLGRPDGTFVPGDDIPLAWWQGFPVRLALGDLNNDGRLDVTFYAKGTGIGVVLGTGGGHLAAPVILPTAGYAGMAEWGDLLTADFDGDGHRDIALLERIGSSNLLEILLGDGSGAFPRRRAFTGLDVTSRFDDPRLAVGDLNGDGLPDLALSSRTGAVSLVLGVVTSTVPNPHAPVAAAGSDQTVECQSASGAMVTFDGSGSTDPDSTPGTNDDIVTFRWFRAYGGPQQALLGTGTQLTAPLPFGTTPVTLVTTDESGLMSADQLTVVVQDTTPPALVASTTPAVLWPPNHRMVSVNLTVNAVDQCGASGVVGLQGVVSSEPDDAAGDGDGRTSGDIQEADLGGLDVSFSLRAERDAGGAGRVYTASYQVVDAHGNAAAQPVFISVPHDVGGVTEPVMIRLDETPAGTRVAWDPVPNALHYNVIADQLAALLYLSQGAPGQQALCIGSHITGLDTSGFEVSEIPAVGEAFYFLVEYVDGNGQSGYGTESAVYDRTPAAPSGACP